MQQHQTKIKDGLLSAYMRKARLTRAAGYVTGKKILDIGCDKGYIIPFLDSNILYHGIDTDDQMLSSAKEQYPDHIFDKFTLSMDTIDKLPDKKFDSIIMVAVIEHLDDPVGILIKLKDKLQPAGRIIITTPHKNSHHLLVVMARLGLARNDKHEHENYVDQKMIDDLTKNGCYKLIANKRFQFGLNQLWVIQNNP